LRLTSEEINLNKLSKILLLFLFLRVQEFALADQAF